MSRKDYPAAALLAAVLFGTSGLGLAVWLFLIVPLCTVAWAGWLVATAPHPDRTGQHRRPGHHLPARIPHL